jgi:hypothetical protein
MLGPVNHPHVEQLALAMRERRIDVVAAGDTYAVLPPLTLPPAPPDRGVSRLASHAGAAPLVATASGSDVLPAVGGQPLRAQPCRHRDGSAATCLTSRWRGTTLQDLSQIGHALDHTLHVEVACRDGLGRGRNRLR